MCMRLTRPTFNWSTWFLHHDWRALYGLMVWDSWRRRCVLALTDICSFMSFIPCWISSLCLGSGYEAERELKIAYSYWPAAQAVVAGSGAGLCRQHPICSQRRYAAHTLADIFFAGLLQNHLTIREFQEFTRMIFHGLRTSEVSKLYRYVFYGGCLRRKPNPDDRTSNFVDIREEFMQRVTQTVYCIMATVTRKTARAPAPCTGHGKIQSAG